MTCDKGGRGIRGCKGGRGQLAARPPRSFPIFPLLLLHPLLLLLLSFRARGCHSEPLDFARGKLREESLCGLPLAGETKPKRDSSPRQKLSGFGMTALTAGRATAAGGNARGGARAARGGALPRAGAERRCAAQWDRSSAATRGDARCAARAADAPARGAI